MERNVEFFVVSHLVLGDNIGGTLPERGVVRNRRRIPLRGTRAVMPTISYRVWETQAVVDVNNGETQHNGSSRLSVQAAE